MKSGFLALLALVVLGGVAHGEASRSGSSAGRGSERSGSGHGVTPAARPGAHPHAADSSGRPRVSGVPSTGARELASHEMTRIAASAMAWAAEALPGMSVREIALGSRDAGKVVIVTGVREGRLVAVEIPAEASAAMTRGIRIGLHGFGTAIPIYRGHGEAPNEIAPQRVVALLRAVAAKFGSDPLLTPGLANNEQLAAWLSNPELIRNIEVRKTERGLEIRVMHATGLELKVDDAESVNALLATAGLTPAMASHLSVGGMMPVYASPVVMGPTFLPDARYAQTQVSLANGALAEARANGTGTATVPMNINPVTGFPMPPTPGTPGVSVNVRVTYTREPVTGIISSRVVAPDVTFLLTPAAQTNYRVGMNLLSGPSYLIGPFTGLDPAASF